MLPCVGCVGVVLGGRCWHSPFPLAMACCDSRPGFCCLKSPSVVYLPSFRHPPLGHKCRCECRWRLRRIRSCVAAICEAKKARAFVSARSVRFEESTVGPCGPCGPVMHSENVRFWNVAGTIGPLARWFFRLTKYSNKVGQPLSFFNPPRSEKIRPLRLVTG